MQASCPPLPQESGHHHLATQSSSSFNRVVESFIPVTCRCNTLRPGCPTPPCPPLPLRQAPLVHPYSIQSQASYHARGTPGICPSPSPSSSPRPSPSPSPYILTGIKPARSQMKWPSASQVLILHDMHLHHRQTTGRMKPGRRAAARRSYCSSSS